MTSTAMANLQSSLMQALAGGPALAGNLGALAPLLGDNGHASLSKSVAEASLLAESGILTRGDWEGSSLRGRLERLLGGLNDGVEANHHEEPGSSTPLRDAPPFPRIEWETFGNERFPAPHDPWLFTMTEGISYASSYIAGIATGQMTGVAFQSFYGVSEPVYRQVRDGDFFPDHWGHFNSGAATRLITASGRLCPEYGQLIGALLVGGIFETQGWSLGTPEAEASWDLQFLYGLRVFTARELLTEDGKQRVLEDRRLQRVVRGEVSLQDRRWHPGRLRKDVFDPWLEGMACGDPAATRRYRSELGDALLKASGVTPPSDTGTEASRLHTRMWEWFCREWYGHLPVEEAAFSGFETFLMDGNPTSIPPGLQERFEEVSAG